MHRRLTKRMRISRAELWQVAQAVLVGAAVLKPTDDRTSL